MSKIKIVGDSKGDYYIEYDNQKIAKVIDKEICELFIHSNPAYKQEQKDISRYVKDHISEYLNTYEMENIAKNAACECIDEYFNGD